MGIIRLHPNRPLPDLPLNPPEEPRRPRCRGCYPDICECAALAERLEESERHLFDLMNLRGLGDTHDDARRLLGEAAQQAESRRCW